MVQVVLPVLIPALVAWACSEEQLIVAAVRGVVQQEEAQVKYQSGLSQLFPPVPHTRDDLVIYGVALEERIKIHLHTIVPVPDSH